MGPSEQNTYSYIVICGDTIPGLYRNNSKCNCYLLIGLNGGQSLIAAVGWKILYRYNTFDDTSFPQNDHGSW